ncbi:MAG: DUF4258 domain-containing protein [Ruminococcus sp.]
MKALKIDDLRKLCNDRTVQMTSHVHQRCRERGIKYEFIKHCIMNGEIIENYPNDYPFPSALVLGFLFNSKPLHVVVGLTDDSIWIITAYYPDLSKWENDYKTRREQ